MWELRHRDNIPFKIRNHQSFIILFHSHVIFPTVTLLCYQCEFLAHFSSHVDMKKHRYWIKTRNKPDLSCHSVLQVYHLFDVSKFYLY